MRGVPWHQQTVGRIETGRQQTKVAEAEVLADLFEVPLGRLLIPSAEAAAETAIYGSGSRLRQHHEAVAQAVDALLTEHEMTARLLARYDGTEWERVRDACDDVRARMRTYALDPAIAEGVGRFEEKFAQDDDSEAVARG